jgi:HSP20 family protein
MKWANLIPWRAKQKGNGDGEHAWLSPIDQFHTEVDRLFDRFFSEDWSFPSLSQDWATWSPSLDVTETDSEITIRAELPGVDPKDLDISVTGDLLTLAGQKEETTEHKEKGVYHSECRYGSFRRSIPLPTTVQADDVAAEFKNGVLSIQLKKVADASTKRIPVATE